MTRILTPALLVLVLPLIIGSALGSGKPPLMFLGVLVIGGLGALAVAICSPQWPFLALAFVLGAAPFAVVPGLPLPIVLILVLMIWVSTLLHPVELGRTDPVELALYALIGTSLLSVVATAVGFSDYTEFVKWLLATSVVSHSCDFLARIYSASVGYSSTASDWAQHSLSLCSSSTSPAHG